MTRLSLENESNAVIPAKAGTSPKSDPASVSGTFFAGMTLEHSLECSECHASSMPRSLPFPELTAEC